MGVLGQGPFAGRDKRVWKGNPAAFLRVSMPGLGIAEHPGMGQKSATRMQKISLEQSHATDSPCQIGVNGACSVANQPPVKRGFLVRFRFRTAVWNDTLSISHTDRVGATAAPRQGPVAKGQHFRYEL